MAAVRRVEHVRSSAAGREILPDSIAARTEPWSSGSLARRINRACGRRGKLFAHRYHATPIRSPRQARNALAYVLNNWRHHREDRASMAALDRFSSAISFDGWIAATRFAVPGDYAPLPVAAPETWLLTIGRRRHPPIDWREVPAER